MEADAIMSFCLSCICSQRYRYYRYCARRASLALQQLVVVVFDLQQLECLVGCLSSSASLDGTHADSVCGDNVVGDRALMLSCYGRAPGHMCFSLRFRANKSSWHLRSSPQTSHFLGFSKPSPQGMYLKLLLSTNC
jgi:hypothetical protein